MRFFTNLSPKDLEREGWAAIVDTLCLVETVVIFTRCLPPSNNLSPFSVLPIVIISFLNLKHRIFHWNANLIVAVYTIQYLFSCSARLLLIVNQLDLARLGESSVLLNCFFLEIIPPWKWPISSGPAATSSLFMCCRLSSLNGMAEEDSKSVRYRCCASYFLSDYEKKVRLWIPLIDIGSLLTMTILSSFLFIGSKCQLGANEHIQGTSL